jgi:16S rRNA processing protein RimM
MAGEGTPDAGVPRHLVVGRIRKPHGIKGELSVSLETDRPEAVFEEGRRLWIGEEPGSPSREVTVERGRPFKGGYLVKLVGFEERNEALDALRGSFLLMQGDEAEPVGEDEIPHHELIGMRVMHGERLVGEVTDLYELGWAEMLVIRNGERETLVPLLREMVAGVDREAGVLELDPPAGLLDL